jgi:hypothetical protein
MTFHRPYHRYWFRISNPKSALKQLYRLQRLVSHHWWLLVTMQRQLISTSGWGAPWGASSPVICSPIFCCCENKQPILVSSWVCITCSAAFFWTEVHFPRCKYYPICLSGQVKIPSRFTCINECFRARRSNQSMCSCKLINLTEF